MLAGVRSCLRFLLSACCVVPGLPAQAQINGVPASVTSFGFGGKNNPTPGVRASVTSLGPNGYGFTDWAAFGNCCANLFFSPANPNGSGLSGRRHHRNHADLPVVAVEPVYVPYAVPYAPESDDDDPVEVAPVSTGHGTTRPASNRDGGINYAAKGADFVALQPPVTAQASTVLVFKDGHKSDVLNYAIVGDTLFDFSSGHTRKIPLTELDLMATHKANDDRGVDFQIPADALGQ